MIQCAQDRGKNKKKETEMYHAVHEQALKHYPEFVKVVGVLSELGALRVFWGTFESRLTGGSVEVRYEGGGGKVVRILYCEPRNTILSSGMTGGPLDEFMRPSTPLSIWRWEIII